MTTEKLRIQLESFNHEILNSSANKVITLIKSISLNTFSMVSLPTRKRIYCVLRSPHVDKDSREHFEIRMHKRILDVHYDSSINIFNLLSDLNLPAGVLYRIYLA
jgi:small subunit ribosomal protein S10